LFGSLFVIFPTHQLFVSDARNRRLFAPPLSFQRGRLSRECRRVVWLCAIVLMMAAAAAAQQEEENVERFRLGPLHFTPTISVTNVGIDTNVFNEAEDPKRDKTGTVEPVIRLRLRAGPSRLSGNVAGQYVYFHEYASQRAWNTRYAAKWEVPLSRLVPFVEGSYNNSKRRPSPEVDVRVNLRAQSVGLGTEMRLSGRTSVRLGATTTKLLYDSVAVYEGVNLADALNSTSNSANLDVRYKLTSLTTLVTSVEALQDRFAFDNIRSSNSIRAMAGFELKPRALIAGRAFVGFRDFQPLNPALPPARAPVASVDATLKTRVVRITTVVARDVAYSFYAETPYYMSTDLGLAVARPLGRSWDLVVRGGHQTLDYTAIADHRPAAGESSSPEQASTLLAAALVEGLQIIRQYGGGLGYRLGRATRLGVDVMYYSRSPSAVSRREYKGLRAGASLTYGLAQ
jgi:hypothetical protein